MKDSVKEGRFYNRIICIKGAIAEAIVFGGMMALFVYLCAIA